MAIRQRMLLGIFLLPSLVWGEAKSRDRWIATWAASQLLNMPVQSGPARAGRGQANRPDGPIPATLNDQTVRMVARITVGGTRLRIRLSNALGANPVTFGSARLAVRLRDSEIVPDTDRGLTFSGQRTWTLSPGASIVSDPVDLKVAPFSDLAISVYLPKETGIPTNHPLGLHSSYIAKGDVAAQGSMSEASVTSAYLWLSGIDVTAPKDAYTIVAFGDSITDGFKTTRDANMAWPYLLARRLAKNKNTSSVSVVNEGFSGNQVLRNGANVSAIARFERDVLSHPNVRWLILLEGINDINIRGRNADPGGLTTDELIAGLRQIVSQAHSHGIKVIGATIMPEEGVPTASARGETIRQAVNAWIRTGAAFDAVVDFDATVRDAEHVQRLKAAFDPDDHIHPNDAGNEAMANAFDLRLFFNKVK